MQRPDIPPRGRGALGNPDNRFHRHARADFDDGWARDEAPPPLATELFVDKSRTVIAYNQSPDVPFDRSINPYRGCEHGCVYCFARPTHAYLDCSPGLDFESRIFYKPEAAALLRKELSRPGYRCRPLALGVNTDAYQPSERKLGLTRSILEVLREFGHPATLITKSALVERDLDLLAAMAERRLVHVMVSVTSLDRRLSRSLEPRAAAPQRRLEVIRRLSDAGIPVGAMLAPVIPFLNDSELEAIVEQVHAAGARRIGYVMIRLPHEVKELFRDWLAQHRPGEAQRIMQRIRDIRVGRDNDSAFGRRMRGSGVYADLIRQRFQTALKRFPFAGLPEFDCSGFGPPPELQPQLALF